MSDHTARGLHPDEYRAADAVFRGALHLPAGSDDQWQHTAVAYEHSHTFGVFDTELIGTTLSWDTSMRVPDGAVLPHAAVSGVGVRSDRTRRGVLTELMRAQLSDCAERGVVTANLHASEGGIYGRFGYGPATFATQGVVHRRAARLRDDLPPGGEVQRLDLDAAVSRLPDIYAALSGRRAGLIGRQPPYWAAFRARTAREDVPVVTVVHHGPAGPDGFAVYTVRRVGGESELTVFDLHAGDADAFVGLWRYLLGVDLVDRIVLSSRPVDEPTAALFTDPRAYEATETFDETWLRLVDVPGALDALRNDGDPLVVSVTDRMLPANTGRYRIGGDGVARTDEPAGVSLDVGTLAMVYLGGWRPSVLAELGRIEAGTEAAREADRVFAARRAPWCGTFF